MCGVRTFVRKTDAHWLPRFRRSLVEHDEQPAILKTISFSRGKGVVCSFELTVIVKALSYKFSSLSLSLSGVCVCFTVSLLFVICLCLWFVHWCFFPLVLFMYWLLLLLLENLHFFVGPTDSNTYSHTPLLHTPMLHTTMLLFDGLYEIAIRSRLYRALLSTTTLELVWPPGPGFSAF